MTDRIDLDELETEADDRDDRDDRPNRGDWFWRGRGDPGAEPGQASDADDPAPATPDDAPADARQQPMPRVPSETDGTPVGIPVEHGGAGAGASADRRSDASTADAGSGAPESDREAADDRGGDPDQMTLAFTYGAINRFADPGAVVADATGWADWVGIVGDVEAHVINKLQRDHALDVDFFNGSGSGPTERLAAIDERSMFFAERMVVVGRAGVDEPIAEEAGWEFVPLADAAGKAGWGLLEE